MAKKPKYDPKLLAAVAVDAAGGKSLVAARKAVEQVYTPLFTSYRELLGYEQLFEDIMTLSTDVLKEGLNKDTPKDEAINGFVRVWQKQLAKIKNLTQLLELYEWQPNSDKVFAKYSCRECQAAGYPNGLPSELPGVASLPEEELMHFHGCKLAKLLGRKTKPRPQRS